MTRSDGGDRQRLIGARSQRLENPFKGVGRNDPCPCGSGKKFKKCCLAAVGLGSIAPEVASPRHGR
jgi:hypothetical protein